MCTGAEFRIPDTWPACREPAICLAADFPTPPDTATGTMVHINMSHMADFPTPPDTGTVLN